jgi:3-oxoacyl-(acyl-carrier-protein) synthase
MGVISAIGNSVAENRAALTEGKCGIAPLELIDSKFTGQLPCGEVKITTERLKQKLDAQEKGVTRTSLLALHAFTEAVTDAQFSKDSLSSKTTALVHKIMMP